jgi:hypothetical protein
MHFLRLLRALPAQGAFLRLFQTKAQMKISKRRNNGCAVASKLVYYIYSVNSEAIAYVSLAYL